MVELEVLPLCNLALINDDCSINISMEIWRFQQNKSQEKRKSERNSRVSVWGWNLENMSERNPSWLASWLSNDCFYYSIHIAHCQHRNWWRWYILLLYSVSYLPLLVHLYTHKVEMMCSSNKSRFGEISCEVNGVFLFCFLLLNRWTFALVTIYFAV